MEDQESTSSEVRSTPRQILLIQMNHPVAQFPHLKSKANRNTPFLEGLYMEIVNIVLSIEFGPGLVLNGELC